MLETTDAPNVAQTIFALFYAITWGMLANVWPRWHAFDVTLKVKEGSIALKRWWISFGLLNLAPILSFIVIFMALKSWRLSGPTWWDGIQLLVVMFQPFTFVGFYWIWISIVQGCRDTFYPKPLSDAYHHLREESDLDPQLAKTNFFWGLGYVLIPISLLALVALIK
jgi:hypothetical protein